MRYAPCNNCSGKRDVTIHPELCRRCRVKKNKATIPISVKEKVVQMRDANVKYSEIEKETGVNINTLRHIYFTHKKPKQIPTFYF